ncbi:hypothetical protein F5884DRAFT_793946 [Xylogone sp. PMI_703]|nr:hypothetical protein F5884DRAFT_793946 [Xylogone sp. PMI_703]
MRAARNRASQELRFIPITTTSIAGQLAPCSASPPEQPLGSRPSSSPTAAASSRPETMSKSPVPQPQWVKDLHNPPPAKSKTAAIPDPPGFQSSIAGGKKQVSSKAAAARAPPSAAETDVLKLKKAWEVALAPVKQLPMTAIMMYMSGNSLQIFSIMMVLMAFKNPVMGLMATNQAFEKFESNGTRDKLLQVKLVYVAMQLLALALGVWKINAMGLLPTTRSDWLAWETARDPLELAVPAL